jgi:hypothetical protein
MNLQIPAMATIQGMANVKGQQRVKAMAELKPKVGLVDHSPQPVSGRLGRYVWWVALALVDGFTRSVATDAGRCNPLKVAPARLRRAYLPNHLLTFFNLGASRFLRRIDMEYVLAASTCA